MTIAALLLLLDQEQPDVRRHPAPPIPHTARKRQHMQSSPFTGPREPQQPQTTGPVQISVGQLLAWAEKHTTKTVARKGEQARTLLGELRQLHAADAELAAADAEEQRLVAELAAVRARKEELRPKRKSPAPRYDQAAVRAWARKAGLPVPDRGSLPAAVVDAWRAATAGGAR
ncbi:histone-like nucleoid-structuring protein Lsr2 [uncultured Streptomyces sp.]|uniref:Lsr2 family DNA-binding protein n=1 Tax=uncultured Streptomyces sp. TaxID=174707 RepID=UPI002631187A|nr:histone-like nucleoid-structuring protein Lsr2 [uncultured Streptomyces sp.]